MAGAVPSLMFDQALHYFLGYAMARSLRGLLPPDEVVGLVMEWATWREELQGNVGDDCEESCKRDLKWWRKGAEAGAG